MDHFNMTLVQKFAKNYRKADKNEKSQIITQVCDLTGLKRNSVVKKLLRYINPKSPKIYTEKLPHGPKRKFNSRHIEIIKSCWVLASEICAERIFPMLPFYVDLVKTSATDTAVADLVKTISLGSLKKIINEFPKSFSSSRKKGNSHLYKFIQAKANFGQYSHIPGNFEVDFVESNGGNSSGQFVCTASYVDIFSGWIARSAALGKSLQSVRSSHELNILKIHHNVVEFHPDNAPSILSLLLEKARGIDNPDGRYLLSRSRPYKKNDNAHVEQKNGDKVRKLIGYLRFDSFEHVTILNQLYDLADLYDNFFIPSTKLVEKLQDEKGRVIKRIHDQPKTPYARLLESKDIDEKIKLKLTKIYTTLNMVELKKKIDKLLVSLTHIV